MAVVVDKNILELCPFCGGKAHIVETHGGPNRPNYPVGYQAECKECLCATTSFIRWKKGEDTPEVPGLSSYDQKGSIIAAIDAWNKRTKVKLHKGGLLKYIPNQPFEIEERNE